MKILRSVDISGLWGSKTLTAKFFPDANFLIGRNGSGKTTVINLIAAVLTADIPTLDKLTFEQIRLELRDYDNEQESIITVSKAFDKSRRFQVFSYVFKDAKGEREYSSDEMDPQGARRFLSSRRLRVALLEELSTIAKVQWLSIHRSPPKAVDEDEDESYESTVDRKLDELSRELIKFFSKIASAGEAESTLFQKNVFGSLLYAETSQWDLVRSASDLNLEQEEATLQEIFKKFRVPEGDYSDQLAEHFRLVKEALSSSASIPAPYLIALVSMRSIHRVVTDWQHTVDRQKEISKPREQFLTLLNDLMKPRKTFTVDEKNELHVSVGGRLIPPSQLSSGEKQMLILFGEALLQERENWIYIADEPELSLHVTWQETLTSNLRQINPNAQIIFATHSPDIVGPREDRVLDMENLLK